MILPINFKLGINSSTSFKSFSVTYNRLSISLHKKASIICSLFSRGSPKHRLAFRRNFSTNFYHCNMFVKRTILLCPSKHPLFFKRSVISPVILIPGEIITCQKMMNFIISKLRKDPLSAHDLIHYGFMASKLNLKHAQPLMAIMFPQMRVLRDEVSHLFPNISLAPDILGWDSVFAAQYANNIFTPAPLFKNTKFTLLDAPLVSPKRITGSEEQYKQTSQPYFCYY